MPIIVIIVLGVVAVALVILEWRSRNKPLPGGLAGQRHTPGIGNAGSGAGTAGGGDSGGGGGGFG
jgi:hypothetical protein